jgi:hypothetical protein
MAGPIFSANDTVAYLNGLAQRFGSVHDFARLYIVPGMNHCAQGPATDRFDALSALDGWLVPGQGPRRARSAMARPYPSAVPYPSYAAYGGSGSIEDAANFARK